MDTVSRRCSVLIVLLATIICGIHAGCVEELTPEVKTCFDQLKNNLLTEAPSDGNIFVCGTSQKDRLDCVIKHFNKCPEFAGESFIEELEKSSSNFRPQDLFHVKSANEFCKCVQAYPCLEAIDITRLSVPLGKGPWNKIANQEYICGSSFNNIDCIAKHLPICEYFIQYKYNESLETDNKPIETHLIDIGNFAYASKYADNYCKGWPNDEMSHECTNGRAGWDSVTDCFDMVYNLKFDKDRSCQMHACIEKNMYTCPKNEMAYFIDAVNIFSDIKIDRSRCTSSANVAAVIYHSVIMLSLLCLIL